MTEATWTELLGGESALLVRLGELIFIWVKDALVIKVVRASPVEAAVAVGEDLEVEVVTEIEVPDDLAETPDSFTAFCREFVGATDEISISVEEAQLLADLFREIPEKVMSALEMTNDLLPGLIRRLRESGETPDARPDIDAINEGDVAERDRVLRRVEGDQK